MKYAVLMMTLLALAACGVDGAPQRPDAPRTGLSVSGDASIGARVNDI